jgi:hypothetical protein
MPRVDGSALTASNLESRRAEHLNRIYTCESFIFDHKNADGGRD